MVTIIQERRIKPGKQDELKAFLRQLRLAVADHAGFMGGETLVNSENPNHQIVVSNWRSVEDWKAWEADKKRQEIDQQMRKLMVGAPKVTFCNVFQWQQ